MTAMRRRSRFTAEEFEYVEASATAALVRLAGSWRSDPPLPADCVLAASAGTSTERFDPLPQPPSSAAVGEWRVAYSVPGDLLRRGDAHFSLWAPDGVGLALPSPTERGVAPVPRGPFARRPRLRQQLRAAEREAAALRDQLALSAREHAQALTAERRERLRAETDRDRALTDLESTRRAHEGRQKALAKAERRLERLRGQVQRELSARVRATELAASLQGDLHRTGAELLGERARSAQLERALTRLRGCVDEAERRLTGVESRADQLRAALGEWLASGAHARRPALDAASVAAFRDELDQRGQRLAELERAAEGLRDAIHARMAAGAAERAEEAPYEVDGMPLGVA